MGGRVGGGGWAAAAAAAWGALWATGPWHGCTSCHCLMMQVRTTGNGSTQQRSTGPPPRHPPPAAAASSLYVVAVEPLDEHIPPAVDKVQRPQRLVAAGQRHMGPVERAPWWEDAPLGLRLAVGALGRTPGHRATWHRVRGPPWQHQSRRRSSQNDRLPGLLLAGWDRSKCASAGPVPPPEAVQSRHADPFPPKKDAGWAVCTISLQTQTRLAIGARRAWTQQKNQGPLPSRPPPPARCQPSTPASLWALLRPSLGRRNGGLEQRTRRRPAGAGQGL